MGVKTLRVVTILTPTLPLPCQGGGNRHGARVALQRTAAVALPARASPVILPSRTVPVKSSSRPSAPGARLAGDSPVLHGARKELEPAVGSRRAEPDARAVYLRIPQVRYLCVAHQPAFEVLVALLELQPERPAAPIGQGLPNMSL